MRYVADTNVISELMKREPSLRVVDWLMDHNGQIYLTSITVKELYFGMLRLPDGKRKRLLEEAITGIVTDCSGKTFPFDAFCGYLCAKLHSQAIAEGRTPSMEDLMIAAICQRNDAVLVTRNVKDFDYLGLEVLNPF